MYLKEIYEVMKKIKQYLRDISCKQKGDTRSIRAKVIDKLGIKIISPRKNCTGQGTLYDTTEEKKLTLVV